MSGNSFLPPGIILDRGDSVHTSEDLCPHLTGRIDGERVHVPYYGQTTLGMYDTRPTNPVDERLPGHRLGELMDLHERFPELFRDSGFDKPY